MPHHRPRNRPPALCALLLSLVALASPAVHGGDRAPIETLADLSGLRLGIIAGTILDTAADDYLDFTQFVYYDDSESQIRGLIEGEIDAIIDDEPVARFLASVDPRLRVLPGTFDVDYYGFALRKSDTALFGKVNSALFELMADGTLAGLEKRWLDASDDALRVMPENATAGDGILRLGVSPVSAPFSYLKNGEVVGLDVELIQKVAERLGMRFEMVPMEFSELIPSLQAGRVDIIGSCLSITEERQKLVRFTDTYHQGGAAAIVLQR